MLSRLRPQLASSASGGSRLGPAARAAAPGGGRAGSRAARRRSSSPARNSVDVVARRERRSGARPAEGLDDARDPGASRPLRPASWVTSWNVRSSARKSGQSRARCRRRRPPPARRPGKWCPLATICVPTQHGAVGGGEAAERLRSAPGARGRVRVEPDQLELRQAASRARCSSRCVPAPSRASSAEPHAGQSGRRRHRVAAVVAVQRAVRWRRARRRSDGQRCVTPQARQWSAGATPRRLRRRIALPPPLGDTPSPASSGAESG